VDWPNVTFVGPAIDDSETLDRLPAALKKLLSDTNGFVAYGGGLHVRGACHAPDWHSMRLAWSGEFAFHATYADVAADDVPFAQDAVGDQWFLREDEVVQLSAETGEVLGTGLDLEGFLAGVEREPVETLGLHPLVQFGRESGRLEPGQLLHVYPPFCTKEAEGGVSLQAVPISERLHFLAELARQMPATGEFRIEIQ
jgi:hypothetical protein